MKIFRLLGMPRLAISARRLYCPVPGDSLVLEVGSGDRPYPRSDVLLDSSLNDYERGGRLVVDRPLVIGLAEQMPFKDGAFDFSIASHVLEHSNDPVAFLSELQRVSRAGYIETPDMILEVFEPARCHRLFVTEMEDRLIITKKVSWNPYPLFPEAWSSLKARSVAARRLITKHEGEMLQRFYWIGTIPFEVKNNEVDCSWWVPHPNGLMDRGYVNKPFRRLIINLVYWLAKMRRKKIELIKLLRCVDCYGTRLHMVEPELNCEDCGRKYKIRYGIPIMLPAGHRWD